MRPVLLALAGGRRRSGGTWQQVPPDPGKNKAYLDNAPGRQIEGLALEGKDRLRRSTLPLR